ncbi:hypothetical protein HDU97_002186 [Phlyctochytrium planicorne]|nr:hypothetical protein HDU97_002186 [Phlyctochytrium planicorne]
MTEIDQGPSTSSSPSRANMRFFILQITAVSLGAAISFTTALPTTDPPTDPIEWSQCTETDLKPLLCATINVPLNHLDKNDTRTIPVALSKYQATNPSQGAILVNPGGPGSPGRRFGADIGSIFSGFLNGSFDVIGFDPRGIGASFPVICSSNAAIHVNFDQQDFIGIPGTTGSITKEGYAAVGELIAKSCQTHSAFAGEWLKYISTASTARDMEAIRKALGQELMNYYGISYGSLLGLTYANLFPGRVGRFIIDGIVDTTSLNIFEFGKTRLKDTNKVLEAFCHECILAGPTLCPLAELPSKFPVKGNFDGERGPAKKLAESLKDAIQNFQPLAAADAIFPGIVQSPQIVTYLSNILTGPLVWQNTSVILSDLLIKRDPTPFRNNVIRAVPDFCPAQDYSGLNGVFAVLCNDIEDVSNLSFDEIVERSNDPDRVTWLGQRINLKLVLTCKHWPRPVERYTGPWNSKMKNKILIVSNTLDPLTPLVNAKKIHDLLFPQNSSLLLIQEAYGHTSGSQPSFCTLQALTNYVLTGELGNSDKKGVANCISPGPIFRQPSMANRAIKAREVRSFVPASSFASSFSF